MKKIQKTAVIGLGSMGFSMAKHIHKKWDGELYGFDINEKTVQKAKKEDITADTDIKFCKEKFDLIIIMVVSSTQIDTLFAQCALAEKINDNGIIVISSTVSQAYMEDLSEQYKNRSFTIIDAPVSGGAKGAAAGTLSIFGSGDKDQFEAITPILKTYAKHIFFISETAGKGSAVKTAHQLLAGIHIAASGEAMALAKCMGIPLDMMYEIVKVSAGYSWLFDDRVPRILDNDYKPKSTIDVFVKDLTLVDAAAKKACFPLPLASAAYQMFSSVSASGFGDLDDAAIVGFFPNFDLQQMKQSTDKKGKS